MKLSSTIAWSLIASTGFGSSEAVTAPCHSSNYLVVRNVDEPKTGLTNKDEQIYLDQFLERDTHGNDSLDEALMPMINQLIQYQTPSKERSRKTIYNPRLKLLVNIVGGELSQEPNFESKSMQSEFDDLFRKAKSERSGKLTDVLTALSPSESVQKHFQYFSERTNKIWQNHQEGLKQEIINYSPTNEEMFIHELSSLVHLRDYVKDENPNNGQYYTQISSLLSIKNKIGADSTTYKHAVASLQNTLQSLAEYFSILVVESPNYTKDITHLQKRSQVRSSVSAPAFKYASKQACEVATDKCSAHGECKESKEHWSCVCEPSFNKTTSKTTTWVGYDCAKKDVSVPANLFLWTSIALILSLVGGVKLLASIGSDPLPGVLDAATLPSKKTI
ncbi:hypothetical protein CANMA_000834 [Candida margitis]|uniref:uncharacterized protein n=1 Tax=Candida margitis TaxID=1775924 RepID=UPI0022275FB3|nr:uncharacterized protein CANMA_000834 [Candida margitis]KAI5970222.1 hypothetical protein CANMA_000834 [Candida margitis]